MASWMAWRVRPPPCLGDPDVIEKPPPFVWYWETLGSTLENRFILKTILLLATMSTSLVSSVCFTVSLHMVDARVWFRLGRDSFSCNFACDAFFYLAIDSASATTPKSPLKMVFIGVCGRVGFPKPYCL